MAQADELCASCSNLDLWAIFTGTRFPDIYQERIWSVGTLSSIQMNTHCSFCRLLRHAIYECTDNEFGGPFGNYSRDYIEPSKVECIIAAQRADYLESIVFDDPITQSKTASALRVSLRPLEGLTEYERELVTHHDEFASIKLLSPESVDPNRPLLNGFVASDPKTSLPLVRKWMNNWVEQHRGSCRRPYLFPSKLHIPFRAVDVSARRILQMDIDQCIFAALSYVWGSDQESYIKSQNQLSNLADRNAQSSLPLPSKLPRTISDAIELCAELSIPHLWVDLFCIDHRNADSKKAQIEGMGYIFSKAQLTLVTISSENAESGIHAFSKPKW